MQKYDKILDIYRIFCYNNIVKKEVNYNKISKKALIELYRKKCEEFDQLEAKFRKLQEEHNQTILELQNVVEKDKLKAQRLFGKKT